jgi:hypothetical protein
MIKPAAAAFAIPNANAPCDPSSLLGSRFWFEYHCYEGHDSGDAACWYRPHEQITLTAVVSEGGWPEFKSRAARARQGESAVYHARWDDGFEWDVFEDEVLGSPERFFRPDPPSPPQAPGP